jgi:uncharacterized protein YbjT (DUF2867 family)
MPMRSSKRILVTGATGFLGYHVVAALLEAGADVTVLARPERQDQLLPLRDRITICLADVWNKASLKGRARGVGAIIHLVGSPHADPVRGLTHHQLNLVPARNVVGMAISDGVPYIVLLSTIIRPLGLSGQYVRSKREAEEYLRSSGIGWTIIRAPALFLPRQSVGLRMIALAGSLFPFNLLVGRFLPLSVDIGSRGIAAIALNSQLFANRIIYARQLRLAAKQSQHRGPLTESVQVAHRDGNDLDEPPFGWFPPH